MTGQKPILFVVNGMGLGNSTRCLAVVEHLHQMGHAIEVASFQNGQLLFEDHPAVRKFYSLSSSRYALSGKRIGWRGLVVSALLFVRSGLWNGWAVAKLLRKTRPAAVVMDSNYSLVFRLLHRGPIFSINNSDRVIQFYTRHFNLLKSVLWHVVFVEFPDFLFQRLVPHFVISPWFAPGGVALGGKFSAIGPIVRRSYLVPRPQSTSLKKVTIVYSGSGLGENLHDGLEDSGLELVVLRPKQALRDPAQDILSSDAVIINGGFSCISECLAARKPMILVPIEGHGEQLANGKTIEQMGVALISSAANLRGTLMELNKNYSRFAAAYDKLDIRCDGALRAAEVIDQSIKSRTGEESR